MSSSLKRNAAVHVWIVEDNQGDLLLLQELLIDLNFKSKNIRSFESLDELTAALSKGSPDIILLDLFLPGTKGIETFYSIRDVVQFCPVIILSGLDNMDTALESVKMGAQDYLIKDEMTDEMINKMINYAIERFANINELKRSEEKYKLLFRSIPQPVVLLDENRKIREINNAALQLFNLNKVEQDTDYSSLFPNKRTSEQSLQALEEEKRVVIKLSFDNGTTKYIEQTSKQGEEELKNRWLISLSDRTEVFENEINKNRIVNETLDEERSRFAKELHDGLAQYLVVLNIHLQLLKGINQKADATVETCLSTLDTSIKLTRSLSYNLSPPDIEKGLIPALESFFGRMQNVNDINFVLNVDDTLRNHTLTEHFDEYQLFRMIQEFINNSIKYSECKDITCDVYEEDNCLMILIKDNGKGFDTTTVKRGLGLNNMRQRALATGFKFLLESNPGKGTKMILSSEESLEV